MRLIDADRLKEVLEKNFGHTGGAEVMSQIIDKQPTAYDVDKVIEQLQCQIEQYRRRADKAKQIECISESYYNYGKAHSYEYALEIVRGEQE